MHRSTDTKKFDRALLALGLIILAAGIIAALTKKIAPPQENTTLVFTQWWEDELEPGALAVLTGEFEAQNPGITVQLDHRSYAETLRALRSNNDSPPDIIGLDPLWFEDLIRRDLLEALDAYSPPAETAYGKWGRPVISFISPLFYNIELLQSAGFDRPPKTRAETLTYARALRDTAAGRYALVMALGPENPRGVYRDLFSWIWASGSAPARDFAAPAITGALAFLKQLRQEDLILPGTFSRTDAEKREDFIKGRAAMMIASVADIHILRERMGETSFGITLVPGEAAFGGKPVLGLTSWYLGIPRNAAHKDEAWAFLSFLLERGAFIAKKAHAAPGDRNSVTDFITGDPLYAKAYEMYTAGEALQEFTGVSAVDGFEAAVREQLYALFENDQSPEETAKNIQQDYHAASGTIQG